MASKLTVFFAELKRRKVYRVAAIYAAVGVAISLGVPDLFAVLLLPGWAARLVIVLIAVGFPIALVLAWAYEVRPEDPAPARPSAEEAPSTPGAMAPAKSSEEEAAAVPGSVAPTTVTAPEQRKSIVVLPFDNMSPDPGDAYFSDGLTEEIITRLSYLGSLRVISRSSAMALKGTQKDVRTIGGELDVQYVLEGSVRKAGDDLRITAQLIDAASDEHLWADTYDGVLEDVFGMQERVAQSIVEELALGLSPKEERFIERQTLPSFPAFECYLKARQHVWEGTAEALDKAVKDLDAALEMVGESSLVLAALGYVYFQKANFGYEQDEAVENAQQCARRALELDPECPQAEVVLGASRQAFLGDQRASIEHLERARQLDPNNPDAVIWLLNAYLLLGRMEEAGPLAELAVKLDPLNPTSHVMVGFTRIYEGRFDLAISSSRRAHEMAPESPHTIMTYAMSLAYGGWVAELKELRERGLSGESAVAALGLMAMAAAEGDSDGVLDLMSEELMQTARRDCQFSCFLAAPLAKIGETDRALEWLENGLNQGFINHQALAVDPFLATLEGEPRFVEFMAKVKRTWEISQV